MLIDVASVLPQHRGDALCHFYSTRAKGISLERMDAIFGQIDAVAAGESEEFKAVEAVEGQTGQRSSLGDVEKDTPVNHLEVNSN